MPPATKRTYRSETRRNAALATRRKVRDAARALFSKRGVDGVTLVAIAHRARVSPATVYALFRSKAGILRDLMDEAILGARNRVAAGRLETIRDPLVLLRLTASVACAVYDGERRDMGLIRGVSAFSPDLRRLETEFENVRFAMQEARVSLLFEAGLAREGLDVESARRILWMYTSRDVYRLLVVEAGWSSERFEEWLAETLLQALTRAPGRVTLPETAPSKRPRGKPPYSRPPRSRTPPWRPDA